MNIFSDSRIANEYDAYYQTDSGKLVDGIEKGIIAGFLDSLDDKELLELGFGTGHWTQFLVDKGFNVTAIDNSEAMIAIAKGKNIDAEFLKADAENLPFDDESFGSIVSITMLEFVTDQRKAINEMYRVMKNSGKLILGILNPKSTIGSNAENDETFRHARFLDLENPEKTFSPFRVLQTKKAFSWIPISRYWITPVCWVPWSLLLSEFYYRKTNDYIRGDQLLSAERSVCQGHRRFYRRRSQKECDH